MFNVTSFLYPGEAFYQCDNGYTLKGESASCPENGAWDESAIECSGEFLRMLSFSSMLMFLIFEIAAQCSPYQNIQHGDPQCKVCLNDTTGTVYENQCNDGYELVTAGLYSLCQVDGSWSSEAKCQGIVSVVGHVREFLS